MARAKRASDEIYNARRRAKRLMARMEREDVSGMSLVQRRARADYMESVRAQIEQSYQDTRVVREVRSAQKRAKSASERLDRMTSALRKVKGPRERSDMLFQRQINLARIDAPSTLGEHGKEAVTVFYAATRHYWRGRDLKERNRIIMQGLGAKSLSEAFETVLRANEQAFKVAIASGAPSSVVKGLTDENEAFYSEVEYDAELIGSPIWASRLVMFG